MEGAKLSKIVERMDLHNFTDTINLEEHYVAIADINRPALQLNGFYEHFQKDRIQLIGNVEKAYMEKRYDAERRAAFG